MADFYQTLVNDIKALKQSVSSSLTASPGAIISLNNNNVVDPSLLPQDAFTWVKFSKVLNSGQANIVDSVSNDSFKSLKYICTIHNEIENKYQTFDLNILNIGGDYCHGISNKIISGSLNIKLEPFNNSGTLEIRVTNNESYSLQMELAKLTL